MKILYIHSINTNNQFYNDYMSDLLLHGLRSLYGKDIIDFPGSWYLYSDEIQKRKYDVKKFWGKGFTVKNILNEFDFIDRTDINQKINFDQQKLILRKILKKRTKSRYKEIEKKGLTIKFNKWYNVKSWDRSNYFQFLNKNWKSAYKIKRY